MDLHIHTLPSKLDEDFTFDAAALRDHVVKRNHLDIVAVTNHNLFDRRNYEEVRKALPDTVLLLPGIEVSVKDFHVLVIANPNDIDVFDAACSEVPDIQHEEDGIGIAEFKRLFGDGSHIVIPHYRKKPSIPSGDLALLGDIVTALEVSSDKKWERESKLSDRPVVLFSDYRCSSDAPTRSGRYTYVSMGDATFASLQLAFNDRTKFAITEREDHFELAPGFYVSRGLNVVIGGRSTGKSFFLDRVRDSCDPEDVVYVTQFSIVKDAEEREFEKKLGDEEAAIKSEYYEPMASISTAMEELPSRQDTTKSIKDFLANLKQYADTTSREDEYSKCPIYSEGKLAVQGSSPEKKVANAIMTLLDDNPLSAEIETAIGHDVLVKLLRLAIERYKEKELAGKSAEMANSIASKVRTKLTIQSSRPACPESPMLVAMRRMAFIDRLAGLRDATNSKAIVSKQSVGKFRRITRRVPHKDATALKKAIDATSSLAKVLQLDGPEFIEKILEADGVTDITHALFDLNVSLENEHGEKVSGGQRAEYLFFNALKRAGNSDVVLIDEPESSFDNPFLNEQIATELKHISERATVFIATHNNVLGVSIKPDGIIFTDVEDGEHHVYSCDASDERLTSPDGSSIERSDILLRLMEAGEEAYTGRRPYYGLA